MTTLNDKIYKLLEEWDCVVRDCDCTCDFEATHNTADEIEKLILQEKIGSLNKVMGDNTWDDDQSATFKIEISELTTELNKLK